MPTPLPAEERHRLSNIHVGFEESPRLQYLAERKLLAAQNDIDSEETSSPLTSLRREIFGLTRKEAALKQRQDDALIPFEQEQKLATQLKVMQDFANAQAATYGQAQSRGVQLPAPLEPAPAPELPNVMAAPLRQPPDLSQMPGLIPRQNTGLALAPDAMSAGPSQTPMRMLANDNAKLTPFDQEIFKQRISETPPALLNPSQSNQLFAAAGIEPSAPITERLPASSVNALLQATKPGKADMGDYIESLAAVESQKKYGKALSFKELASKDPALATHVRQQAAIDERKAMYQFEQGELGKRQLALAGPLAEETAKSREAVQSDIRLSGPTMIMGELTDMLPKLFLPESEGGPARLKQGLKLRKDLALAEPTITKWSRGIATAMRPQLARAEGEVGNLAAQEQLNSGELIPDPMGGTSSFFPFFKLPDTKETAVSRMKLATDFISLASKAPKGERETSQVQTKLRGIKQKLDMLENTNAKAVNAGAAPLGDLTPTEFDYAKNLASQGITRERVEAILRAKRVEH